MNWKTFLSGMAGGALSFVILASGTTYAVVNFFSDYVQTADDKGISFGGTSRADTPDFIVGYDEATDNRLEWTDGAGNLMASLTDDGTTGTFRPDDLISIDDITVGDDLTVNDDTLLSGAVSLGSLAEVTIASGAITISSCTNDVDTESDAASDDLDTINGGVNGQILILRAESSSRTVVMKDGTGNLNLEGDFSMDDAHDKIGLIFVVTNWQELFRSNNS